MCDEDGKIKIANEIWCIWVFVTKTGCNPAFDNQMVVEVGSQKDCGYCNSGQHNYRVKLFVFSYFDS